MIEVAPTGEYAIVDSIEDGYRYDDEALRSTRETHFPQAYLRIGLTTIKSTTMTSSSSMRKVGRVS